MEKKQGKVSAFFLKLADKVSYGMGTPANIMVWIFLVLIWVVLGATKPELFINGSFLPTWFTSTGWNFPLNTVTTLAELYIGFLVAAAANRSERELRAIVQHTDEVVTQFENMEEFQTKLEEKILSLENTIIKLLKNK